MKRFSESFKLVTNMFCKYLRAINDYGKIIMVKKDVHVHYTCRHTKRIKDTSLERVSNITALLKEGKSTLCMYSLIIL